MDESVVKVFEQQQVGKLKLSDAIRIGAKLRPQCECELFADGGSCALGAAYEGITGQTCESHEYSRVINAFPALRRVSGGGMNNLGFSISSRNDSGETREQIADWLESQGH